MSSDSYLTGGGIRVHRTVEPIPMANAIEPIVDALDARRGVLLASSYEYPGRYTRWDMGFVDPPLVLVARGRELPRRGAERARARAAARRSRAALAELDAIDGFERTDDAVAATVRAPEGRFAEEERSRQPSVFSRAARAGRALPPRRRAAPRALRRLRLRPRASSSSRCACASSARPTSATSSSTCPTSCMIVDHRREVRHAPPLRLRGGRPRHRRAAARRRRARPYAGARRRSPRPCDHAPGEYAAMVARGARGVQARRPLRGRARPDVLRALPVARRRSSSAACASATPRPTAS